MFDEHEPDKQRRAEEIVGRLAAEGTGAVSAQVLSEFASLARRKTWPPLSADDVLGIVRDFVRDGPVTS